MKKLNIEGLKTLTQNYVQGDVPGTGDAVQSAPKDGVLTLPLSSVEPDPEQPRKTFDDGELDELANSICRYGLLQPIVVREKEGEPNRYIIVAGERRWRACRKLEKPTVQALLLRTVPEGGLGYLQMIENLQRSDLTVEEVAVFISRMIAEGASQQEVADRLGLRRDRVSLYALWERFPDCVREAVREGRVAAIRAACDLRLLWERYPAEVETYLSEGEEVSLTDVRRFAKSLENPENRPEPESTEPSLDASEADREVPDDSMSVAAQTDSDLSSATDTDLDETEAGDPDFSDEEETEDDAECGAGANLGEDEEDQNGEDEAPFETDEGEEEIAAMPTVHCRAEGRPCRLLWRSAAEERVWIRWEDDGTEEEVPVEAVQLLSVECGGEL